MTRRARFSTLLGVAAVLILGGCSTPANGRDDLAAGKRAVVALVTETAAGVGNGARYEPPTVTGQPPCHRSFLGYHVARTGRHRAEVPLLVKLPEDLPLTKLLATIETDWRDRGYRIDRSRLDDARFPQLRAHAPGGYDIVATGYVSLSQIMLYAVSDCLGD